MSEAGTDGPVHKGESPTALPWGIRFRYVSPGNARSTLRVVRAAVAGHVPGLEIREAAGQPGWFEAVPPPLPAYVADDPAYLAGYKEQLKGINVCPQDGSSEDCIQGVKDVILVQGVPKERVSAFLDGEHAPPSNDGMVDQLWRLVTSDAALQALLQRWRPDRTRLPLLYRLITALGCPDCPDCADHAPRSKTQAARLCAQLCMLQQGEQGRLAERHRGELFDLKQLDPDQALKPADPPARQLRVYSFDPSLATTLATAPIHQVTIPTRWEPLERGPIGDYLEVVDVDPASDCAYLPVDLDHRSIVALDGLPPSEGNPQFHQQMVYAVAMNTIHRFELALGRPVFWSPLRPWLSGVEAGWFPPSCKAQSAAPDAETSDNLEIDLEIDPECRCIKPPMSKVRRSRYIQRLRIYPHALREANAYYSPSKRALLFGYFPSEVEDNGMVFTCLSHDIIVHETTHAIVDGMHSYFNENSNSDVWAFHEAFADIMALFQHFTYPEVLRHQIASTRGGLETSKLLGQLAQQFSQAIGCRGSLRNHLGKENEQGAWERSTPNPQALRDAWESHERGSILVAAVFDAFLALYNARVSDLLRISTGGTGVLPAGRIHPDLANRLAGEAAAAAEEVLRICIRALDYLPPVDVTFGEFLRALITADYEISPTLGRDQRIAFINAFRSWGIYPRDVTTLSEESLRWRGPAPDCFLQVQLCQKREKDKDFAAQLAATLEAWRPGGDRRKVFAQVTAAQEKFYCFLRQILNGRVGVDDVLPGLDLAQRGDFNVENMRPARNIGPQGEFRTSMIVEVVQTSPEKDITPPIRGGATLVIDLQSWEIRYIIYKRLYEQPPCERILTARGQRRREPAPRVPWQTAASNLAQRLAATYAPEGGQTWGQDEPFALLHRRT